MRNFRCVIEYNYEPRKSRDEEKAPGLSVFYKNEAGEVFHTYSTYARGGDILIGAYNFLDLTPKGCNEASMMDWMRLHDNYGDAEKSAPSHDTRGHS